MSFKKVKKKFLNINFLRILARKLTKYKLGDLLLSKGIIDKIQLEYALLEQRRTGEKLGKILIRQGSVSPIELYYKLTEQWCARASVFGIAIFMQVFTPNAVSAGTLVPVTSSHAERVISVNSNYKNIIYNNEIKSNDISKFKKWNYMLTRYEEESNSVSLKSPKFMQWKQKIHSLQGETDLKKITEINNYFNSFRYIEDKDNYNKSDYWATPIEFISRGGDCEDFAIAKYASLLKLGFNMDQLRVSVVFDELKHIHHAILVVRLSEGDFILDNQNKKVENMASVKRYKVIFSINGAHWWLNKA